ncbi:TRAP transporter small permease [Paracoccus sp. M683]|uniref:TRAP transporter small permease n=1 Tax=Paracoccus sp. M683 TaxID=2594268 RepID=UPI00117C2887|nr:TRAP transporter small permease subunit [Paracoccus sp. M683]TRW93043.1 TRAP transporter small permease [Paracoccus sp. M683]
MTAMGIAGPSRWAAVVRAYDRMTDLLALLIAGGSLVFVLIAVITDVALRALGQRPPVWTGAATEHLMLLLVMAIAPWLVRHHANVRVTALTSLLPARAAPLVERGVGLAAAATCALIAVVAARMGLDSAARGEMDIRAIEVPRWILFAQIAIGFGLCATELARQGLGAVAACPISPDSGV